MLPEVKSSSGNDALCEWESGGGKTGVRETDDALFIAVATPALLACSTSFVHAIVDDSGDTESVLLPWLPWLPLLNAL